MTWITTIPYHEAEGRLKTLYDRVSGPNGEIDNILAAHSLRPHTLDAHMALYKNTLHHPHNQIEKWFLETVGVYVSLLNRCQYCVEHHFIGLQRLLNDAPRGQAIRRALEEARPEQVFSGKECLFLQYAATLTTEPFAVTEAHIAAMRAAGATDGEILEINQVSAYFSYANRTVLGLGVNTQGDVLGLSPGDSSDPDNWNHR